MAQWNPVQAGITTIENGPPRIPIARENFRRAGREGQITLLEGDAGEILPELLNQGHTYDWIFMDAAKGQYPILLPTAVDLLEEDGVLITDNVLFDGEIIESRYAVTRRNRTIHKRMRDYLYTLTHHELLQTTVLPVGDGAAVSVKK
jgi:predicted O-methyltransferase YrrM